MAGNEVATVVELAVVGTVNLRKEKNGRAIHSETA